MSPFLGTEKGDNWRIGEGLDVGDEPLVDRIPDSALAEVVAHVQKQVELTEAARRSTVPGNAAGLVAFDEPLPHRSGHESENAPKTD